MPFEELTEFGVVRVVGVVAFAVDFVWLEFVAGENPDLAPEVALGVAAIVDLGSGPTGFT